jgi:hypothetical protein
MAWIEAFPAGIDTQQSTHQRHPDGCRGPRKLDGISRHLRTGRRAACVIAVCFGATTVAVAEPKPASTLQPTIADIQAAYERELTKAAPLHNKDLAVVAADCSQAPAGTQFLCWITFTIRTDPTRALDYDVATLDATPDGFFLKSGLCKR